MFAYITVFYRAEMQYWLL